MCKFWNTCRVIILDIIGKWVLYYPLFYVALQCFFKKSKYFIICLKNYLDIFCVKLISNHQVKVLNQLISSTSHRPLSATKEVLPRFSLLLSNLITGEKLSGSSGITSTTSTTNPGLLWR